jgi:hypothetical protein
VRGEEAEDAVEDAGRGAAQVAGLSWGQRTQASEGALGAIAPSFAHAHASRQLCSVQPREHRFHGEVRGNRRHDVKRGGADVESGAHDVVQAQLHLSQVE